MGSEKPRVCLRNQGDDVVALLGGHALHVGEKQACGQTDSQNTLPRAVADTARENHSSFAARASLGLTRQATPEPSVSVVNQTNQTCGQQWRPALQ